MSNKSTKKRSGRRRPTPKPRPLPSGPRTPASPHEIRLVAGKGTPSRGGGVGGKYWHIYVGNERTGYVYLNKLPVPHDPAASIQIQIDRQHQGRRIGRIAYRLACEQSGYTTIYAEMRKSNIASRRAAEEAGFVTVENPQSRQLTMVWHPPAVLNQGFK